MYPQSSLCLKNIVALITRLPTHFKGTNTLRNLLMPPKDKDSKLQKSGVISKFKCPHIYCPEEYIGESGRNFGDSLKEHLRAPPPIHHHSTYTGHNVSPEGFTIVSMKPQGVTRNIKNAMYIHVNDPSINRNLESINSHIYGTRFYKTHQPSISNNPALLPPYMGQITLLQQLWGHMQLHW